MIRRLPEELEKEILSQLLQGASYRAIGRRFGVSIASVSRVAEDARKRVLDFDSLRALAVLLKKAELSVFDAARAGRLVEAMNMWGISVVELGDYIRAAEKLLSERDLNEDFIFYAVKLLQLEEISGRTYQEVVEDFENKIKETAKAEERKTSLENENLGLKAELKDNAENLAKMKLEITEATTVRKGLKETGMTKLSKLVRFIKDFESMGFDTGQVKRLAVWRRELEKLRIDPDGLANFIAERGSLEAQNNSLRLNNERLEADIDAQSVRRMTLIAWNSVLQMVDQVLTVRIFTMPCKSCGYPLPIALPTKESLGNLIGTGRVLRFDCRNCGVRQWFSPWDLALQIAWIILPTEERVCVSV